MAGRIDRAASGLPDFASQSTGNSWPGMGGPMTTGLFGVSNKSVKQLQDTMHRFRNRKKLLASKGHVYSNHEFHSMIQEMCYHLIRHWSFDVISGIVILYNLAIVIIETNCASAGEDPPKMAEISSTAILAFFVVEMGVRLFVWRWDFMLDSCNIFELALVVIDVFLNLASVIVGKALPISFLRVVRLSKLARVSKVLRVFKELRVLVGGLGRSLKAIFWGSALLALSIIISAIIAVQLIEPLNAKLAEQGTYPLCDRCPNAFKDVYEACLTIVVQTVIGDGWTLPNLPLIENYPATAIYFALSHMVIGMAVINLIFGLVVNVAIDQSTLLGKQVEQEKLMEQLDSQLQLLDICQEIDKGRDGHLTRQELADARVENARFIAVLEHMNVGEDDLEVLWAVLDGDKKGSINYTDFATNCYRLKTSDSQVMLAYTKYYISQFKKQICEEICSLRDGIVQETDRKRSQLKEEIERDRKKQINEEMIQFKKQISVRDVNVHEGRQRSKEIERQTLNELIEVETQIEDLGSPRDGGSLDKLGLEQGYDNISNAEKQTRGGESLETKIMFEELQALLHSLVGGMNQTLAALDKQSLDPVKMRKTSSLGSTERDTKQGEPNNSTDGHGMSVVASADDNVNPRPGSAPRAPPRDDVSPMPPALPPGQTDAEIYQLRTDLLGLAPWSPPGPPDVGGLALPGEVADADKVTAGKATSQREFPDSKFQGG